MQKNMALAASQIKISADGKDYYPDHIFIE